MAGDHCVVCISFFFFLLRSCSQNLPSETELTAFRYEPARPRRLASDFVSVYSQIGVRTQTFLHAPCMCQCFQGLCIALRKSLHLEEAVEGEGLFLNTLLSPPPTPDVSTASIRQNPHFAATSHLSPVRRCLGAHARQQLFSPSTGRRSVLFSSSALTCEILPPVFHHTLPETLPAGCYGRPQNCMA